MSEQAAINGHAAVEKLEVRKDDIELGGVFTSCEIIGIETVDTVVASDIDMSGGGFDARIGVEDIRLKTVVGGELVNRILTVPAVVFQQSPIGRQPQFAAIPDNLEHSAIAVRQCIEFPGERIRRNIVAAEPGAVRSDPQHTVLDGKAAHKIREPVAGVIREMGEFILIETVTNQPFAQRCEPQMSLRILANVHHVAVMPQADSARNGFRGIVISTNAHLGTDPQLSPRIAVDRIDIEIVEPRAVPVEMPHLPIAQIDAVEAIAVGADPQPVAIDSQRMDIECRIALIDHHMSVIPRAGIIEA